MRGLTPALRLRRDRPRSLAAYAEKAFAGLAFAPFGGHEKSGDDCCGTADAQ